MWRAEKVGQKNPTWYNSNGSDEERALLRQLGSSVLSYLWMVLDKNREIISFAIDKLTEAKTCFLSTAMLLPSSKRKNREAKFNFFLTQIRFHLTVWLQQQHCLQYWVLMLHSEEVNCEVSQHQIPTPCSNALTLTWPFTKSNTNTPPRMYSLQEALQNLRLHAKAQITLQLI